MNTVLICVCVSVAMVTAHSFFNFFIFKHFLTADQFKTNVTEVTLGSCSLACDHLTRCSSSSERYFVIRSTCDV